MPILRSNQSVSLYVVVSAGILWLGVALCCAQTFEVTPRSDVKPSPKAASKTSGAAAGKTPSATSAEVKPSLGWGSGLEVPQQPGPAQAELAAGDYAAATSHAERAAKAAPQNADLWFLFGYAA